MLYAVKKILSLSRSSHAEPGYKAQAGLVPECDATYDLFLLEWSARDRD